MVGFEVKDKVCVVTGGAQGLGKNFALDLLRMGARVCITDINEEVGLAAVKELTEVEGFDQKHLTFSKHDVRDKDNWSEVFTHCDTFFEGQPVELLINNAGVGAGPPYDTVVDINLKGVMHGTKAFLEKYGTSKGGRGGRIIQVASMAGLYNGLPFSELGYNTSKWGVVSLTRAFSDISEKRKYMPSTHDQVKSYCLCPFFVRTQMTVQLDEDRLVKKTGQRKLTVDEVSAVMKQALKEDLDGTVYAIMPNMPPIKVPNFNYSMLIPVYIVASSLFKNSGSVDALRVLAGLLVALLLLSFLMGFAAHYMINMLI